VEFYTEHVVEAAEEAPPAEASAAEAAPPTESEEGGAGAQD
jgi:hypothetical protein